MHSTTKYFGGHSDVLGGALVFARDDDCHASGRAPAARHRRGAGAVQRLADPARLPLAAARMAMHCRNARAVAEFLAAHPAIERGELSRPGLASRPRGRGAADARFRRHAQHRAARRPRRGAGDGRQAARCSPTRPRWAAANRWSSIAPRSKAPHPISPQNLLRLSVGPGARRRPDRRPRARRCG